MIWVLGAVLALVLALLWLPVTLSARFDSGSLRLRLGVLGGLVRMSLPVGAGARAQGPAKPSGAPKRRPSSKLLRAGLAAALEALGKIHLRKLSGEVRVGLGDPALTGEFYGRTMGPLAAMPWRGQFRLVPLFDRQTIEGQGEAVLSLVPARLIPVGLRFLWALR